MMREAHHLKRLKCFAFIRWAYTCKPGKKNGVNNKADARAKQDTNSGTQVAGSNERCNEHINEEISRNPGNKSSY